MMNGLQTQKTPSKRGKPGRLAVLGSRPLIWLALVLVAVPTVVMLVAQLRWLREWQSTSKIAEEMTIRTLSDALDQQMKQRTTRLSDAYLSAPSSVLTDEHRLSDYVKIRARRIDPVERRAVSYVMAQSFMRGQGDAPLFVNASDGSIPSAVSPQLTEAAFVATIYWKLLAQKLMSIGPSTYSVEEKDARFPIILAPISDEERRLIGVIGIVLDPQYVANKIVPSIVEETMRQVPRHEGIAICVHGADGQRVYATRPMPAHSPADMDAVLNPGFVLSDWRFEIKLWDRVATQLEGSLMFNIVLSLVLALMLLAGILLAFRTATRHLQLSQMKNDFVANVSHELRTPISSIRAFSELLSSGRVRDPDKVKSYGQHIESESVRLGRLIENILDFAPIETGLKEYVFRSSNLSQIIGESINAFRERLPDDQTELRFLDQTGGQAHAEIDAVALRHAIDNLIDNAIKYGQADNIVTLTLDQDARDTMISISDRGVGIAKSEQDRVFDRFHRVGGTYEHDVKGTGLGLAIVKHVVQAHGGRCDLSSQLGAGSTFTLRIPNARHSSDSQPTLKPQTPPNGATHASRS